MNRTNKYGVSVRTEVYDRIQAEAKRRGCTMNDVVAMAIEHEPLPGHIAVDVSLGIQELIGDHVVRHGGEACAVFEAAIVRALDAAGAL